MSVCTRHGRAALALPTPQVQDRTLPNIPHRGILSVRQAMSLRPHSERRAGEQPYGAETLAPRPLRSGYRVSVPGQLLPHVPPPLASCSPYRVLRPPETVQPADVPAARLPGRSASLPGSGTGVKAVVQPAGHAQLQQKNRSSAPSLDERLADRSGSEKCAEPNEKQQAPGF